MKNVWKQLKPHYQIKIRLAAHKYTSAKRLKYTLMSQTSWYDLTVSQVSDISVYCDIPTYKLSAQDLLYGNNIINK